VLPTPLTPLFKIPACPATGAEFAWVYRCQAEGPFRLCPAEIERGDWFSPAAVTRWVTERPRDFADTFPLLWQLRREKALPGQTGAATPPAAR
jgi:isopentenyl-diphosphate Delta-isomerase